MAKKRKRGTVFPFTVLCTCQNGVFRVFFFLFLLFYLLLLHTPARLLCNTTETPSGIEKCCNVSESVCVCVSVWSRTDPTIPKTHFLCLFHFRTLSHTHTHTQALSFSCGQLFFFFFFFFLSRETKCKTASSQPPHTHTHTPQIQGLFCISKPDFPC